MTTANGTVVRRISRDCCPYLDDYEPNYSNPAVAATTPATGNSVTWDPTGPTYDEPRAPVAEIKGAAPSQEGPIDEDRWILPQGKSTGYRVNKVRATLPQGRSTSSWKTANTYHSGYVIQASDFSDSSDDEPCVSWTHPALSGHTVQSPRNRELRPQRVPKPTTGLEGWTVIKKTNPKPIKLTPRGIHDIFDYFLEIKNGTCCQESGDGGRALYWTDLQI
jgi:hypothetical protein